jgi:hypothetical protein
MDKPIAERAVDLQNKVIDRFILYVERLFKGITWFIAAMTVAYFGKAHNSAWLQVFSVILVSLTYTFLLVTLYQAFLDVTTHGAAPLLKRRRKLGVLLLLMCAVVLTVLAGSLCYWTMYELPNIVKAVLSAVPQAKP